MPSRFVSLAILIYWSIAAFLLLTWDVLPELTQGYAPDLRAIALAGDSSRPVRWNIQVVDDPRQPELRRSVGESITTSSRRPDGFFELTNHAELDAGGLFRGTPFASRSSLRVGVESLYLVDQAGNLNLFSLRVVDKGRADAEIMTVTGKVKGRKIEIESHGWSDILNRKLALDYEPRSVVHDVLGPQDRLPGLHVGQRWESKGINMISGQVESVRVDVVRRGLINWEGNPVTTFEVVHRTSPFSMKTWVRTDGLILRQEVPFPFVRLVLERRAESDGGLPTSPKPGIAGQ
jgi:hypothetical protein